jgi:hypothetical protein
MSKKKVIIILVVAALLIAGGVIAYILTQQSNSNNNTSNGSSDQSQNDSSTASEVSATLRSLFTGSDNRVCTYSDLESSGTVYSAGDDRLRVDYSSTDPTQPAGGMIMTSDKVYIWDIETQEGYIMPAYQGVAEGSEAADESVYNDEEALDVDKDYNFSCSNWSVDSSTFTPPASIEFTDIEAMMRDYR